MRLQDLPVEVLRTIFDGDDSSLVLELWKTGDRLLCNKLANGGVSYMILHSRRMLNSPSRWPRCLKHLKLVSLKVSSEESLGPAHKLRDELNLLQRGLKRLTVHNHAVARALLTPIETFSKSSAQDGPSSSSSSHDDDDQPQPSLSTATLFRFCDVFPELEHLEITGSFNMPVDSMALLPASLTSLVINELPSLLSGSYQFPPRLTHIESKTRTIDLPELKILPSTLTSLPMQLTPEARGWFYSEAGEAHFPALARFVPPDLAQASSSAHWQRLDSLHLILLEWNNANFTELVPLPIGLTEFTHFHPDAFAHLHLLPTSLTTLRIGRLDWPNLSSANATTNFRTQFSRLRTLYLHMEPEFDFNLFYLLPRNLESLKVENQLSILAKLGQRNRFELKPLDDNFTSFIASFVQEHDRQNYSELIELSNGGKSFGYSSENIGGIEKGLHYGLPLTLKSIDFYKTHCGPSPTCHFCCRPKVLVCGS